MREPDDPSIERLCPEIIQNSEVIDRVSYGYPEGFRIRGLKSHAIGIMLSCNV